MRVDKVYCMSSYLMFRTVLDEAATFSTEITPKRYQKSKQRMPISNSLELEKVLSKYVAEATKNGKAALALSGGIDSAILARFMPKGSTAYTFKCVVPGIEVTDETPAAANYAHECGLKHEIVEIYWEDFERLTPSLMLRKGAPIHSIEVQIYKAAMKAKLDGFDTLIFGESADCLYGGLSNVLSREWKVGDFIERYSFLMPYHVLKQSKIISEPFQRHQKNGYARVHEFFGDVFFNESVESYLNACENANVNACLPYAETFLEGPLDYERVRRGENKYLVREVFQRLYKDFVVPAKTPMPRPMNEWLQNWKGPNRKEFWPNCVEGLSGDQKWQLYCLERFLSQIESGSE